MKKITFFLLLVFISASIIAQPIFISSAKIEFNRKTIIPTNNDGLYNEQPNKPASHFKNQLFSFEFASNKSIYRPEIDATNALPGLLDAVANQNIVYSDFNTRKYIGQKQIFEKTYLIEDSLRVAHWKITNDFRNIAGFNCRRATTIIMDSVFVVAFYTDEIMISGGPEGINGLPGMILGLVINRLHSSWYATKVEVVPENKLNISPPIKGEKTSNKKLKEALKPSLNRLGNDSNSYFWAISI